MGTGRIKEACSYRLAGALSGLLLMLPNIYPVLAPIQLFALLPILLLGMKEKTTHSTMLTAGFYMGLVYTLPQMFVLRLPIPVTVILLVDLIIVMIILTWGSVWVLRKSSLAGAFAVGFFLVVLDWINFTAIPIWGTAQSIVRPWSYYPHLIQFSSLTGITGIIFIVGTLQALAVGSIVNSKSRLKLLGVAVSLVLVCAITNVIISCQQPTGKIKVAAIGWSTNDFPEIEYAQTTEGFDDLFTKNVAKAAESGAKLVVSPEMGFYIDKYDRPEWMKRFRAISVKHNISLAIGYFDTSENQNRLIYITPKGELLPEYSKTYLTPYEDYCKGDGQLRIADLNGVSAGGMICQDDNFTKLSQEYGRRKVAIVAVPTLDWSTVKSTHLQNSIHRAIESRYAIVRATVNGISAIIAPGGEVLASCDHFSKGPAVIIAEVPFYEFSTFFSIAGHWPVAVGFVFLSSYFTWILFTIRFKNAINQKD